ncbi:hypothetical protein KBC31_04720 [Candidatus Saccharibacteria bacterium]|nr:hypothetical protein [Candidatus Saccharibacteria bacterium]
MKEVWSNRIAISLLMISLLLVVGLAASPADASGPTRLALSGQTLSKLQASNKQQQKLEDRAELPCQIVRIRLQSQSDRASLIRLDRVERYERISSRLENLVERLQVSKMQIGELPQTISVLRTRINSFQTASTTYESSLRTAAGSACTVEVDQLESMVETARNDQKNLIVAASNVDTAINNQVVKNLETFTLTNINDTVDTNKQKQDKANE